MIEQLLNSKPMQYLKPFPRWLLAGGVSGDIPFTVSQALPGETAQITGADVFSTFSLNLPDNNQSFGITLLPRSQ